MTTSTIERRFVPVDFDPTDFANIQPLFEQLSSRELSDRMALEQWLLDASELFCAIYETGSRINIDYSCHTDDPEREKAFMNWVEQIRPKLSPAVFALQKQFIASPARAALEASEPKFAKLSREWEADVAIFREENIPIFTEVTKLVTEYDKLCGAMMIDFRGKQRTMQQMGKFLEETDRPTREAAWQLIADRRLQDREAVDAIFDQTIAKRHQAAQNAGFDDFIGYQWQSMNRFDYTPADCVEFSETIARLVMPLVERITETREQALGVDTLRPWDTSVDLQGRAPLEPFDEADIEGFVSKTRTIFTQLHPQLGEWFGRLKMGRNLDLDSRKGKRPGGYQASLEESREPFIFMNAAGTHRDLETMLHEGGHAFHYMASCDEPLVFLRHANIEFCEVASMSMELLGLEHAEVFYNEADAARAMRAQLEGIIKFFPWMATIDSFQHWLYAHPTHTREQRTEHWLSLMSRFGSSRIDWTGYEESRAAMWQRQIHLFHHPFYYVEYGIAQLGALQVWLNYLQDGPAALADLQRAFALGGTRPLPELFEAAGIRFDFSEQTLTPLMQAINEKLNELPA